MDEPGAVAPSDAPSSECVFVSRDGLNDRRVFKIGERVCIRGAGGGPGGTFRDGRFEVVKGTITDMERNMIEINFETGFPSQVNSTGQLKFDLSVGGPYPVDRKHVGKLISEDPGAPGGRRRSSSKRVRKVTRRHRKRKSTRKLGF